MTTLPAGILRQPDAVLSCRSGTRALDEVPSTWRLLRIRQRESYGSADREAIRTACALDGFDSHAEFCHEARQATKSQVAQNPKPAKHDATRSGPRQIFDNVGRLRVVEVTRIPDAGGSDFKDE